MHMSKFCKIVCIVLVDLSFSLHLVLRFFEDMQKLMCLRDEAGGLSVTDHTGKGRGNLVAEVLYSRHGLILRSILYGFKGIR